MAQVAGSLGLLHQVLQRGKHFGAAACFQMLDETTRRVEILRAGGKRLRRKLIKCVVEGQNAEAIVRAKPVERLKQRLSSLGKSRCRPSSRKCRSCTAFRPANASWAAR